MKTISNADFYELYKENNNLNIIDVREDFEYHAEHIPGAVSVPLSKFSIDLDKTSTYYVICQSGSRSGMACQALTQAGYDVVNVIGGMSGWRGELK